MNLPELRKEVMCYYCENEADYQSILQMDMLICKDCVEEYVKQEVLTKI